MSIISKLSLKHVENGESTLEKGLKKMSQNDLRELNDLVIKQLKHNNRIESLQKSSSVEVGQIVEVNHPKLNGKWEITKIKVTKCDITQDHQHYTIPMSLICS
jgi:hypothetical protein